MTRIQSDENPHVSSVCSQIQWSLLLDYTFKVAK